MPSRTPVPSALHTVVLWPTIPSLLSSNSTSFNLSTSPSSLRSTINIRLNCIQSGFLSVISFSTHLPPDIIRVSQPDWIRIIFAIPKITLAKPHGSSSDPIAQILNPPALSNLHTWSQGGEVFPVQHKMNQRSYAHLPPPLNCESLPSCWLIKRKQSVLKSVKSQQKSQRWFWYIKH